MQRRNIALGQAIRNNDRAISDLVINNEEKMMIYMTLVRGILNKEGIECSFIEFLYRTPINPSYFIHKITMISEKMFEIMLNAGKYFSQKKNLDNGEINSRFQINNDSDEEDDSDNSDEEDGSDISDNDEENNIFEVNDDNDTINIKKNKKPSKEQQYMRNKNKSRTFDFWALLEPW